MMWVVIVIVMVGVVNVAFVDFKLNYGGPLG